MRNTYAFLRRRILAVDIISGEVRFPSETAPVPAPRNARVLIRMHGHPIGTVEINDVPNGVPTLEQTREAAWSLLADRIAEHAEEDGLTPPEGPAQLDQMPDASKCSVSLAEAPKESPLVTVAMATMTNAEACARSVQRVLDSSYKNLEVVVVDNAPEHDETRLLLEARFDGNVRYAPETRRGLSCARNKGLSEARGEIIVFIDDDVIVDEQWLSAIVHAFSGHPEVVCVTGAIVAAELETPAQAMLEQFGGFNKGSRRQVYDMGENRRDTPLYPFDSGRFGSGANIAMRTEFVRSIGGFAEDLGAGTPAHGGEDIDILRRVVSSGNTLVYEPAALMWHFHRRTYRALERQMFRYGVGLSATVTSWLLESPKTAWAVISRLPAGARHVFNPTSDKNRRKSVSYPRQLTVLERAGLVAGPLAYLRSRMRSARK